MSIVISNVTKTYGDKTVLKDFSMEVHGGERVVLMGTSGSGKTTLLRILMGLEPVDSGTVDMEGGKIGAVFQENRLCESFTVRENMEMVLSGKYDRKLAEKTMRTCLEKVGLEDWENESVSKLSGGMKRRVAIVRAIMYAQIMGADTILMDEPFKGLDEETKLQVMEFVRGSTGNRTFLLVTHDASEAVFFSGRVVVIE